MANLNATANVTGITEFKKAFSELGKEVSSSKAQINLAQEKIKAFGATEANTKQLTDAYNRAIENQSKRVQLCKENVEKLTAEHGENSAEVRKATDQMAKEETALVKLQGGAKKAAEGTNDVTKETGNLSREASNSEKNVSKLKEALIVAGGQLIASGIQAVARAIAKVAQEAVKATTAAAQWADEINTLSVKTGIAVETIQELQYASKMMDFEFTAIEKGITKVTKGIASAQKAGKDYIPITENLSVSIYDSNGALRESTAVMFDAINAIGSLENETERDIIAQDMFGKSYMDLIPLISGGSEELNKYAQAARDMGIIIDAETVSKLNNLNDTLDNAKSKLLAMKESAVAELAPAIEDAVNNMISLLSGDVSITGFFENILEGADKVDDEKIVVSIDTFMGRITEFFQNAPNMIEAGTAIIKSICDGLNGNAEQNGSELGTAIGNTISALTKSFDTLSEPVTELAIKFTTDFAVAVISNAPTIIWNVIKGLAGSVAGMLDGVFGEMSMEDRVASAMVANGEVIPESMSYGMVNAAENTLTPATDEMLSNVTTAIEGVAQEATGWGEDIPTGIAAGIRAEAPALWQAVDFLAAGISTRLGNLGGSAIGMLSQSGMAGVTAGNVTNVSLTITDPSPAYTDHVLNRFNVDFVNGKMTSNR